MKNLLLAFAFLLSLGAFAQIPGQTSHPLDLEGWFTRDVYTCDANGNEITSRMNPKYKKYTISIHIYIPHGGRGSNAILNDRLIPIKNYVCQNGELGFWPGMKLISTEYSLYNIFKPYPSDELLEPLPPIFVGSSF
ncbi:hypothetical protein QNH98_19295 [Myroides sp. mNGS23_01]|nr:hypothetical protein [Myroides sp. mNGS23_01]WHT39062.1 hypothetical protein QNH98_19295 [Myroides sp. mNGS23_01]